MPSSSLTTARLRLKEQGTPENTKRYLHLWYHGPRTNPLRAQFDNDLRKYLKAYQPSEQDFRYFQDLGMESFIRLEQQALRKMRLHVYRLAGQGLCEAFMRSVAIEQPAYIPNVVFVAIDFEGSTEVGGKGIGELGISTFQTKSVLSIPVIDAMHYSLRAHRNRKFCFGETVRTHGELLPGIIHSFFAELCDRTHGQIVLVCHNLQSELRILDDLGVALEDLHITGVLDTYEVGRLAGVSVKGSLRDMLEERRIPWRQGSLHCAGNDACYTMKLVLGYLQEWFGDPFGRLKVLVGGTVPEHPHWKSREWQEVADDGDLESLAGDELFSLGEGG